MKQSCIQTVTTLVIALVGSSLMGSAIAYGQTQQMSNMLTGCIGPGGDLIHVAAGQEPRSSCPPSHVQKTWALSGEQGAPGISCWDLDEDGVADTDEDLNKDGVVDVLDCRPAEVYQPPTERTWYVASNALLFASQQADPTGDWGYEHDMNLYTCNPSDDIDELCVPDPAPDPCGLWYWDKEVFSGSTDELWSLRPTRGYQYSVQKLQDYNSGGTEDPTDDSFGWENCLAGCLADTQCVGASITESGEEALACRLIARIRARCPLPARHMGNHHVCLGLELFDRHQGHRHQRLPGSHTLI
jgi:hypothetical protein